MTDAPDAAPVALVTAAGRGMGAACARELHRRGYSLALLSPSEAVLGLAEEIGLQGSVTEPDDLAALVERTMEHHGRIDGLVNNTGHPAKGPLLELTDADWHAGLDLLLLNVVRMARLVTPIMERQQSGAIVNIASFSAFEPTTKFPVSSALRAALAGFTKMYADSHAASGIRMNSVLPGYIDSHPIDEEVRGSIPMQRAGRVTEVATAVAFLLSADAGYVTGQSLRVDGGITRSI